MRNSVLATIKRDELVLWTPRFFLISGLHTFPFQLHLLKVKGSDIYIPPPIVRFTMYFCSEFMEICKPIHFWKAY